MRIITSDAETAFEPPANGVMVRTNGFPGGFSTLRILFEDVVAIKLFPVI